MVKIWKPWRKRGIHASKRHGVWEHVREFLWPSMGLRALTRLMGLKLLRQAGRPHYVALGAALGIIVAFFPILGTHTILLIILCSVLGGSFVAALISSSVLSNPWALGPVWAASFQLGRRVLGMKPGSANAVDHLNGMNWSTFLSRLDVLFDHVIFPTIVGGALIGGPLAIMVYVLVYWRLRARRGKGTL